MLRPLLFATLLVFGASAHAADLNVTVRTRDGMPVEHAVVTFRPAAGVPAGPIHFDWPMRMSQHNIAFDPHVLIAPVGADVAFPNLDNVRHHVYSFAKGNRFELQLFSRDETRSYRFMTPGVAAIGCNIHDRMSAFVVVVDTPFAGQTDAAGHVTLHNANGAGALTVWQEDVRAPGNQLTRPLTAARPAGGEVVEIDLRAMAPAHMH